MSPECSLEGLMLKLKLQYFGHLMWRTDSLEKTLMMGKIEGRRRRDNRGWEAWMASLTRWTWVWAISGSWWWTCLACCSPWGSQRVKHDWVTELNWSRLHSWWQRINLEDLIAYLEMVLTLAICMAIQSKLVGQKTFEFWDLYVLGISLARISDWD